MENSFSFLTEEGNFYRLDMDIERAEVLRLELIDFRLNVHNNWNSNIDCFKETIHLQRIKSK